MIVKQYNILKKYDYIYILLTNYFANQLFMYFFFYLMSPFLGFIITVIIFLTSIFLFIETKKINKKASYYIIPYIIYNTYALILITSIYFMNF
jgi:translocator protein